MVVHLCWCLGQTEGDILFGVISYLFVSRPAAGARFAKWRAVLKISEGKGPSTQAILENAHGLARYAQIAQVCTLP